jgi:hypothetical protein
MRLSKTAFAWLALAGGTLGLHRFALRGPRDAIGWLHVALALVGAVGWWRLKTIGVDDVPGAALVPALGASVVAAMVATLRHALAPDAVWQERTGRATSPSGGLAVVAAIVAAFVGATAGIATIAFAIQRTMELAVAA